MLVVNYISKPLDRTRKSAIVLGPVILYETRSTHFLEAQTIIITV
jgi:hypothetical protein